MPHWCPYHSLTPDSLSFCEQRLCSFIAEPQNAWSNLAVVFVGLLLWKQNSRAATPTIALGIASFLYHASGTLVGAVLDLTGMYFVTLHFIFAQGQPKNYWPLLVLTVGLCAAATIALPIVGIFLFIGGILFLILRDIQRWPIMSQLEKRRKSTAMLFFFVGVVCWGLDQSRLICKWLVYGANGHMLWHLFSALAIYYYARAFHIEETKRIESKSGTLSSIPH